MGKMAKGANGSGSIRKRPDGLWEGRYTIGRDTSTGKQIRKSVYGHTQQEVRKKLQAATSAIDNNVYIEPSKITYGQWLNVWLKEYCNNIKQTTLETYTCVINLHIMAALGSVKLQKLSPVMIQTFYNNSLKGTADGKNALSPKSIKRLHAIIHHSLKQACEVGYIKNNPADPCKLPNAEKPALQVLDKEQTKRFISALENNPLRPLFLVALFTGMRQSELLGLTWNAVDFKNGKIQIYQQLQYISKKGYIFTTPKNGKPRTITPAPFVFDTLRAVQEMQKMQKIKAGELWENKNNLVFVNEIGKNITTTTAYKTTKRIAREIGVPALRFHDLRHTYAVAAIRAGDDIKTISENLGHASVAFTLDIYGHVTEEMKRTSADRIQAYINELELNK